MIAAIIGHLVAAQGSLGLKLVGGAAEFQRAAERNPTAVPAAYVFVTAEDPAPAPASGPLIQRVAVVVGVALVVRNVADATGAAASLDMDTLRGAVKAHLFGWQPNAECDPLERGPSNLLAFKDGHLWWQDSYITAYYDYERAI